MAYVDSSALTPIIFGEQPDENERQEFAVSLISEISEWITPHRRLDDELLSILEIASLPALPLWHLANAMYFRQRQSLTSRQYRLAFITLDEQQETAARELGLFIP